MARIDAISKCWYGADEWPYQPSLVIVVSSSLPSSDRLAHERRIDHLVADRRADQVTADRQHHHRVARRERGQAARPAATTNVEPLASTARTRRTAPGESCGRPPPSRRPGRAGTRRCRSGRRRSPTIWSLPNSSGTPTSRASSRSAASPGLVLLEHERRRRLGPDHELRAAPDDVARHRDVGGEDAARLARLPLVVLRDVGLHQADAQRRRPRASAIRRRSAQVPQPPTPPSSTTTTTATAHHAARPLRQQRDRRCAALTNATSADRP